MKVLQTANLGKGYSGISGSIRYQLFDTLGSSVLSARNTGVYELGTSTGLYGVQLDLSTQFSGSIVWSVDGNTRVYATEEVKIDQKMARYIHTGRWLVDENTNQMVFYQDDNNTEIARYALFDRNGVSSITELFERRLIGTGSV
jgi:hypothetical protein|tara:strand:- start:93 stop:524 length:432 start_codon:yes stop_codon:yes gene_type:complete